jgi:hypothetical protein
LAQPRGAAELGTVGGADRGSMRCLMLDISPMRPFRRQMLASSSGRIKSSNSTFSVFLLQPRRSGSAHPRCQNKSRSRAQDQIFSAGIGIQLSLKWHGDLQGYGRDLPTVTSRCVSACFLGLFLFIHMELSDNYGSKASPHSSWSRADERTATFGAA